MFFQSIWRLPFKHTVHPPESSYQSRHWEASSSAAQLQAKEWVSTFTTPPPPTYSTATPVPSIDLRGTADQGHRTTCNGPHAACLASTASSWIGSYLVSALLKHLTSRAISGATSVWGVSFTHSHVIHTHGVTSLHVSFLYVYSYWIDRWRGELSGWQYSLMDAHTEKPTRDSDDEWDWKKDHYLKVTCWRQC